MNLKILKLTRLHATSWDDSATTPVIVHKPDGDGVMPEHVVIRYMKDEHKCCI